jgi:hypothetical protein
MVRSGVTASGWATIIVHRQAALRSVLNAAASSAHHRPSSGVWEGVGCW